ncbi:MAG: B12-binding domain-containing radical SAM protein [Syntrophorhabdaceae bacterium]|nr:B12-binding domain-containing radical SAM protein [Syntrophorhabdaceae bacterium]
MTHIKRSSVINETGALKKNWRGKIPVCVVFPNSYYVGMSNLAVHLLYETLNNIPEIVCERAFFHEGYAPLSIESKKPLKSFELIFFTVSFELDYINIVKMLMDSEIHIHADEREEKEPLIVAGGPLIMANPEPLSSFFDLFIMGDIEATISEFINDYLFVRTKRRSEIIETLSMHSWVYNPRALKVLYGKDGAVEAFEPKDFKVRIKRYMGSSLAKSSIITENTEFSNIFLVEGTRGCPSRCHFCLIGNIYPFVFDKEPCIPDDIKDVGIIGGGVSFHPELKGIIEEYIKNGKSVHFPSLRIDRIGVSIIEMIKDSIKTLTFGIEAGSEGLRASIGKPLKDSAILEKINEIMEIKPFNLKLYFMIGLPDETKKDIECIVDITKKIKHIMIKQGAKKKAVGRITVHVSPFVPKPATPFQREAMDDMDSLGEKIGYLKKSFARVDNTFFTYESVKYSFLQGVFARGDRKVSDIILRFSIRESLLQVMKESPINLNFYALRKRDEKETLPWGFISFP